MEIQLKPAQLKRIMIYKYDDIYDGDKLGDLYKKFGPEAHISIDRYYDEVSVGIRVNREENDEEYQARIDDLIDQEKKKLQKKEDRERKEYERLKAKFEGK